MKPLRLCFFLLSCLAVASLLAGARERADAQTTARAPYPTKEITLRVWDTAEQTKAELYRTVLIPEYKKRHPNVTIDYQSISTADLLQKLLATLTAGTGPEVFTLGDWFLPTYYDKKLIDPVVPEAFGYKSHAEMIDGYIAGLLGPQTNNGMLYAVPIQMNAFSLFMNNRLFKEAGLDPQKDAPKSWEDVARLSKKLTKRQGNRIVQKGFELRYTGDNWLAQMFHTFVYQAGGDVLQDGKPAFNGEAGLKALSLWKTLTLAPKVTQNTAASPYQDFAVEQDAMTFAGPNGGAVVEKINPKMAGNYTVVSLPQINSAQPKTMMYSFNLVVNTRIAPELKTVAWDFIAHAIKQPAVWMQRTRMINPVKGWTDTAEAKQVPFLSVFIHDLSIAKPMARSQHFVELQSAIARAVDRVVHDNVDPKQSLDQAAADYSRAIANK
jgi:multiple sugar transport system substrate-binding protein